MRVGFLLAGGLVSLSMFGCTGSDQDGSTNIRQRSESTSYSSPEQQRQLKEAFKVAKIAFKTEMREGREFVVWDAMDSAAVKVALESPAGPELPAGRHAEFSKELKDEFENWLKANNVSYSTKSRDGREYLVWSGRDDAKVHEWLRSRLPESIYAAMYGGGSSGRK
jgi:hypothetical protein